MNIIFLILKILWVVLQIAFFIVLFILFLLLVILFANLKYKFKTNTIYYDEKTCLDFDLKATYLFSSIKVFANKKDDKIKILIKIFGYSLYKNVILNSLADNIIYKNEQNEEVSLNEEENSYEEKSSSEEENKEPICEETDIKQEGSEVFETKEEKVEFSTKDDIKDIKESVACSDNKLSEDKETSKESVQATKKSIRSKKTKQRSDKAKDSASDKEVSFIDTLKNKDFALKAFEAVVKLLKTLKPEKFTARFKIGFEDPSLTGKVIGMLYTIRGLAGLDMHCEGEFNHSIPPDIFMYVKGRVSIFRVIRPFLFIGILFIKFKIKNKFGKQKGE